MTEEIKPIIKDFEAQAFHMQPAPNLYETRTEYQLRCIEALLENILKRIVRIEQLLEDKK